MSSSTSAAAVAVQPQLSTFSGPSSSTSAPFVDTRPPAAAQTHESQPQSTSAPTQGSSTSTPVPDDSGGTTTVSCKQCGSTELDSDPSRGDTVCMSCGYVLEESLIVSEVCFEEDGHGGASAIGQFVSSESKGGGGVGLSSGGPGGANYHQGIGKESREITLRAAKRKITEVAQQLRLNQHHIDMSFNFFKMALHKQLTKGRRHPLTVAACIYMTCRIEGTPHLLIDFSDVVQMDIYALGRAYIQLSRALFINIPAVDPCMYILRFAHKFNLGAKTHEVGMTAVRLVQRMKRDWLHLGRRPSGLCGAALLIAARLHNFSRTVQDVIQVVKVHETTLRKRLIEFGETPSSSLTIEEFMSVDLEEEHDPPSFKVARIKDREHLQKLLEAEDVDLEMTDLQRRIEEELEKRRRVRLKSAKDPSTALPGGFGLEDTVVGLEPGAELDSASRFILNSTLSTIDTIISEPPESPQLTGHPRSPVKQESRVPGMRTRSRTRSDSGGEDLDRILMPPPSPAPSSAASSTPTSQQRLFLPPPAPPGPPERRESKDEPPEDDPDAEEGDEGELDFSDIDDAEIDSYIMSNAEAERKRVIWEKLNNEYLVEQERKRVQMEQDILDGKFDKKKKVISASGAKVPKGPSTIAGGSTFQAKSASEAIKIMLTERRMSSKINYDVLRRLASTVAAGEEEGVKEEDEKEAKDKEMVTVIESGPIIPAGRRRGGRVKEEAPEKKPKIKEEKEKPKNKEEEPPSAPQEEEAPEEDEDEDVEDEEEEEADEAPDEIEAEAEHPEEDEEEEVVVESGPVAAAPPDHGHPEEDEEYEEEDEVDEEDEAHVSARELLTKFRGADGEGDGEEGYDDYYD